VHDLAFKIFPESFDYWRLRKLNFFHDTAVKRANKIIAISEATKKDLLKFHPKIDAEKIKVVYHGFEKELFTRKFSEEQIALVKEKYQIKGRYLLYVGAIQPRKNLVRLVEAFEMFKNKNKEDDWSDLKLVFVGEKAWKSELTIEKINNSEFHKDIVLTGKVDFEELAILYNQAEIFIYPSIYEGFGIPILEAMASGTPVIAADNSSLIEIGLDAVEIFETKNSGNLFEKIKKVLLNEYRRNDLIQKGFKRIEDFSWKKCAEETLRILKE
jgi:glycosyltransferase involved in cell wall biosynthesis